MTDPVSQTYMDRLGALHDRIEAAANQPEGRDRDTAMADAAQEACVLIGQIVDSVALREAIQAAQNPQQPDPVTLEAVRNFVRDSAILLAGDPKMTALAVVLVDHALSVVDRVPISADELEKSIGSINELNQEVCKAEDSLRDIAQGKLNYELAAWERKRTEDLIKADVMAGLGLAAAIAAMIVAPPAVAGLALGAMVAAGGGIAMDAIARSRKPK